MVARFREITGVFLFTLMFLVGCTPPPVKLNYKDRKIIDSLYKEQATPISKSMDSICDHDREARLRKAIDSIYRARLAERELLMEKLPKDN